MRCWWSRSRGAATGLAGGLNLVDIVSAFGKAFTETATWGHLADAAGDRAARAQRSQGAGEADDLARAGGHHGPRADAVLRAAPGDGRARSHVARRPCADGAAADRADGRGRGGQPAWRAARIGASADPRACIGRRQRRRVLWRGHLHRDPVDPADQGLSRTERHLHRAAASVGVGDPDRDRRTPDPLHAPRAARPSAHARLRPVGQEGAR